MIRSGVYILKNLNSGKMYLGSSYDVFKRWEQHKRHFFRGVHRNKHLQSAWLKDGLSFEVLLFCDKKDLLLFEQRAIDHHTSYDPKIGYNLAKDAQAPMLGRKHTEVTKSKMSLAQVGKVLSEDTKQKIRVSRMGKPTTKGRVVSKETKERMSVAAKQRPPRAHSEETKAKISLSNKGRPSVWSGKTLPEATKTKMAETRREWWNRKKECP